MKDLFSERYGYIKQELQIETLSGPVRNHVWDELHYRLFSIIYKCASQDSDTEWGENFESWEDANIEFLYRLHRDFLGNSVVNVTEEELYKAIPLIQKRVIQGKFYEAFDVVEFVLHQSDVLFKTPKTRKKTLSSITNGINKIFEERRCAYRLINKQIIPVANNVEAQSIAQAMVDTDSLSIVNRHLEQAIKLYADRKNPDYRNAAKESISALESLLKLIAKTPNATMGDAIKEIGNNSSFELHPALSKSLHALYGWSSNASGIRHSHKDDSVPEPSNEDAKLIIVTCCSYVSYLLAKANKAKIDLTGK